MLPEPGVTGKEPFASGTLDQKKEWLGRLYMMMQRARVRAGASAVDDAIVGAGWPRDSLEKPFTFTDEQSAKSRLEGLLTVLWTFVARRSPASLQNPAPTKAQADVLTSLMDEVQSCYNDIAGRKADQEIEYFFSVNGDEEKADQVRALFRRGAETAGNVSKVLQKGNPAPGVEGMRIFIDDSGELVMKSAEALSSPSELIIKPFYGDSTTDPAVRAARVDTLLHECMHIVSRDIKDMMYWPNEAFRTAAFAVRINNADHFARVAIKYREPKSPPPRDDGPTPGGGGPTPEGGLFAKFKPKDKELLTEALVVAKDWANRAWRYCLNAWNVLKLLQGNPGYYDHLLWLYRRYSMNPSIMLASQAGKATLHERSWAWGAWLPSVTAFDLAALEEIIVDLSDLIGWLKKLTVAQLVGEYPENAATGVLYVLADALNKARDSKTIANSFLAYGYPRSNQTMLWLRPDELISKIQPVLDNRAFE
jgi:hypothetical protein